MPTPKFPKYPKDSLRPNPEVADPSRGDLAFAQEQTSVGHFGDWNASGTVATGLPSEGPAKPGGLGYGYARPIRKSGDREEPMTGAPASPRPRSRKRP